MENISGIKEKCVGCKSCEQSCPKHCISMLENKEGFWYPSVDEECCVECGLCLKKCAPWLQASVNLFWMHP